MPSVLYPTTGMLCLAVGQVVLAGSGVGTIDVVLTRAVLGGLCLVAFAVSRGVFSGPAFMAAWAPGVALGIGTLMLFEALTMTSVTNASLLNTMQPIVLLIAGAKLFGERMDRVDIALVVTALMGAVLVMVAGQSGGTGNLRGDGLAVLSMFFGALYFVLSRRSGEYAGTVSHAAGLFIWGGLVAVPLALFDGTMPGRTEPMILVAVAVVTGTGHLAINAAHRHVSLALLGASQLLIPVTGTILAALFLRDRISLGQGAGMLTVLLALAFQVRRREITHA